MSEQQKNKTGNIHSSNEGYQPTPNDNFGYQPKNQPSTPPAPPRSGSNIISPRNNNSNKK